MHLHTFLHQCLLRRTKHQWQRERNGFERHLHMVCEQRSYLAAYQQLRHWKWDSQLHCRC